MMTLADLIEMKASILWEQAIYRSEVLARCKTQEEKDKYLDRWALEDSAEKIADAIRSNNTRRGFFF